MSKRSVKGDGSWFERTINGKTYQCYKKRYEQFGMKTFYGATKSDVREKRNSFEENLASGIVKLKTKKRIENEYVSTVDIITELIETEKQYVKQSTKKTDCDTLQYYIKTQDICNKDITDITKDDMIKLMDIYSNKYSAGTINHIYNLLSQGYELATEREIIISNPLKHVRKPTESKVVKKKKDLIFLSEDDMNKLYLECQRKNEPGFIVHGAIGESAYGINAYAVALLLETGVRVGELLGLRYKDVDLKNNTIYIKHTLNQTDNGFELTQPKTQQSIRLLPLTDKASYILKLIVNANNNPISPEDFVIMTSNGTHPLRRNIARTLNQMLIRSGCETKKCTLHSLRHSFASRAIKHGIQTEVLASYLGHRDANVTREVYIHIIEEQKLQAISKLNQKELG